ncbi:MULTISPECIES: hypothetical protein [Bacillus]|jgi:hypothetical protein|uniref:Uncharacterized protein n=1 Tax=Bacillus licheniformis (strain ATCC 14580 / DSM 13 / JCM 2505 / CCUG 7422 / NBRC 12200 / NCIMB 9375 / NCTC 10341 / NRRL NRS-1264 / Gibson 46) TaxID=279010 RepID=Q65CU0_BACLD|nr:MULTISPECIES: hypothetical protein [Bacillus]AAU25743.1 hypothetical protein BL05390 [Bacillus licheniformis DSM 13 = ATCC 14580]AAU43124.1 putative phage protein [Bacillus licheniformis DSM 13 = ATCC 14580]MBG9694483.1 hypothetical protein [Bacillus licheniformis]MCA1180455.1 hypothetical protein [Bacillus licheniformis]MCM3210986.1 hypothetical protein [Bacillus licheniformis]
MNKDKFQTTDSKSRVTFVNELLKREDFDLQKVADVLEMNYSTFTKLMQEDDYVYIKRENQYYKFVRDESQIFTISDQTDSEMDYIKANFSLLKSIIERYKHKDDFIIDKRIFRSTSKTSSKNFRMPDDLYQNFVATCENEFPHLKIQDIIAQLLLDFTDKYSDK